MPPEWPRPNKGPNVVRIKKTVGEEEILVDMISLLLQPLPTCRSPLPSPQRLAPLGGIWGLRGHGIGAQVTQRVDWRLGEAEVAVAVSITIHDVIIEIDRLVQCPVSTTS